MFVPVLKTQCPCEFNTLIDEEKTIIRFLASEHDSILVNVEGIGICLSIFKFEPTTNWIKNKYGRKRFTYPSW